VIETIRQGLQNEGIAVSIARLCRWIGVPRRTVCYEPVKSPSFGYRTIAHLLGFNKSIVQRMFQLVGRFTARLVFTFCSYTAIVRGYGLRQACITPYCIAHSRTA